MVLVVLHLHSLSVIDMCYSPTLIKNPYWHHNKDAHGFLHDCSSQYIPVPCGHCGECIALRSASYLQRCQLEQEFGYCFFCTLTYNDSSMPYLRCSDGYSIRYADIQDFQNMVKRLRSSDAFGRPFRYLAVSELGSKKGRPHFHVLWFVQKYDNDNVYTPLNLEKILWSAVLNEWRRNYGSTRNPDYRPLCTFVSRWIGGKLNSTYDLHFVLPNSEGSTDDVSFYVCKYLFKDSEAKDKLKSGLKLNLPHEEFKEVWSKVKPRCVSSLNFGFGSYDVPNPRTTSKTIRLDHLRSLPSSKYVRSCVDKSLVSQDTPQFYDVETGKALPLSRYWYRFGDIINEFDVEIFHEKSKDKRIGDVNIDERSLDDKLKSLNSFEKNKKQINYLNLIDYAFD